METALLPLDAALRMLATAYPAPDSPALVADRDDPALDRSAMDGAALRSADGLAPRRILGTLFAGDPPGAFTVEPGTCVRIMTGACLPAGADAVMPIEELRTEGDRLVPTIEPEPGRHIRRQGEQARTGDLLLAQGRPRTAARAGLAAQVGRAPEALRRVRVGVAPTGDEIQDHPQPHQIRDSNGPMLAALAHALGAEVRRLPPLPDHPETLRAFLADLGDLDLLLTSGGVSVGERDHLPKVLADLGARSLFHKICLKPGKPMLAAFLPRPAGAGAVTLLGLPGNPVSAYLNCLLFLPVAMAGILGTVAPDPWKTGQLRAPVGNPGDRPLLHPCLRTGDQLEPLVCQGSADLVSLAQADACAWVPMGGMGAGPTRYLDLP
jgi:molybdopterin molybdotransferase